MKRREFITLLGGTAAAWPLAARAQQPERMRRIGVLMNTNPEQGQTWHAAFIQALQQLGWQLGGNVQVDTRWGAGNTELFRKYAAELVALNPMLSWALPTLSSRISSRSAAPCRSYSSRQSIRLAAVSLRAWRGPAATPPALPTLNLVSTRSCWTCSKRCRPTRLASRSSVIPSYKLGPAALRPFRPRHRPSALSRSRSACVTLMRLSTASRNLPAGRMAG